MAELPLATPSLARKVWESMRGPSARRVATKLRQSGLPTSHQTINRWRQEGWRRVERSQHPLEVARAALDDAVPVLTSDPMTVVEVLVRQSAERENLEQLSDAGLLRRAAREVAMAVVIVAHAVMRQEALALIKPAEVGILFRSLAACVQAITAGFAQASSMQSASTDSRK